MERKTLDFQIKAFDNESGELTGYGNVSGIVDRADEIVERGAYVDLDQLVKDGFSAVGHNWFGLPIGTLEEAREDDKGLFVRIKFHSTREAQDARTVVRERLERGKSVGLSIGYDVLESKRETRDGKEVRILSKIRVFEVSVVTIPANQESLVVAAKHQNDLSGVTLEKHAETVVSMVEALAKRASDKAAFRQSEGRDLSETQKSRIAELVTQLGAASDSLSSLIADEKALDDNADVERRMEELRTLEAQFILRGIGTL
jgi:HK97 family phage prohead protease